jgi:sec-independent protein translocase protein TatA
MPNLGVPELLIILAIILLLFGAKKLPELARTIGTSAKELRSGLSDDNKDDAAKQDGQK